MLVPLYVTAFPPHQSGSIRVINPDKWHVPKQSALLIKAVDVSMQSQWRHTRQYHEVLVPHSKLLFFDPVPLGLCLDP
jgi:hypothetical protein